MRVLMRKLSDIVRHPSIPGLSRHDSLVVVEYSVDAPGHNAIDLVARLYREIGFPGSIVPTNVAHISGATEERVIFVSIWQSERDAEIAYADAEPMVEKLASEVGPGVALHRSSYKAHRVTVGPESVEHEARLAEVNPDCVAFTIDIPDDGRQVYDHYCEQMDFPVVLPDGLLLHVAYEVGKELKSISVWQTIEHSQAFMRDRIIPAAPGVVREQGVFPEIRPVEFKPTLLAFNLSNEMSALVPDS